MTKVPTPSRFTNFFLLRGEADPVFIDVMEGGVQLDWREALEKVREACPDAHHRVLLEPMAPGMVRDAVIGDESGEKECVYTVQGGPKRMETFVFCATDKPFKGFP